MILKEGYVYHIKEDYFTFLRDNQLDAYLMQNKENGATRPTFFCLKDSASTMLWMIPMSSRVEKYEQIKNNIVAKKGVCDTIILGEYAGRREAFLIQNMFPILPEHIDHEHIIKGNMIPVHSAIVEEINRKVERVLFLLEKRNIKIVFPDIVGIKSLMMNELARKQSKDISHEKTSIHEKLAEAKRVSGQPLPKTLPPKDPKR